MKKWKYASNFLYLLVGLLFAIAFYLRLCCLEKYGNTALWLSRVAVVSFSLTIVTTDLYRERGISKATLKRVISFYIIFLLAYLFDLLT